MEAKDKIKVLFDLDGNGYITGWQQEFFDGYEWQAPFDTSNAVEMSPEDLNGICLGASKVSEDGTITTDADKKAEIEAEANKATPTTEQQLIATLSLRLAQMEAKP